MLMPLALMIYRLASDAAVTAFRYRRYFFADIADVTRYVIHAADALSPPRAAMPDISPNTYAARFRYTHQ